MNKQQKANTAKPTTVLQCMGLTQIYHDGTQKRLILDQIDLCVPSGSHMAIIGASGSGKSTLLQLLGGLSQPTSGHIHWSGTPIASQSVRQLSRARNQQLGFVYQRHHLLPEFSVLENVCMPLQLRGHSRAHARQAAWPLLEAVEMHTYTQYAISQLSGGQKQRVALARALITRPACVLADEPTGNLDQQSAQRVYHLHTQLTQQYNTSFVIATHDMLLAKRMDTVWRLAQGKLKRVQKENLAPQGGLEPPTH